MVNPVLAYRGISGQAVELKLVQILPCEPLLAQSWNTGIRTESLLHEKTLGQAALVRGHETEISHQPQRREAVAEEAVESFHTLACQLIVTTSRTFVTAQDLPGIPGLFRALCSKNHFGKCSGVTKTEVDALSRQRMDRMRGVPYQRNARQHVLRGMLASQRERGPLTEHLQLAEAVTESLVEPAIELAVRQGQKTLGERCIR